MGWESEQDIPDEPTNRMKWVWLFIAAIFVITIVGTYRSKPSGVTMSQAHVQHILVKFSAKDKEGKAEALSRIEDIQTWTKEGQDFEKLAKQYSEDLESKSRGGDLGWVTRGVLVDEIEAYIWTAEIGNVSDVITSTYGFHLVRVLDREISAAEQYELELNQRINERNNPE
jgi:parvulin-like peptidyl-prolyl isomerase